MRNILFLLTLDAVLDKRGGKIITAVAFQVQGLTDRAFVGDIMPPANAKSTAFPTGRGQTFPAIDWRGFLA